MVLLPRQPRSANLSFVSSLQRNSRVTCSSDHEPLNFKDANWFLCWQSAMRSEIATLQANSTWSLVLFEPSMNVVGCCWVYKIKRQVDGAIDRYKARLVARGFTQ